MTGLTSTAWRLRRASSRTIVSIAANGVEGVACIGPSTTRRPALRVRQQALHAGHRDHRGRGRQAAHFHSRGRSTTAVLPDLAASIRQVISDAVTSQVGIPVGSVDVYIDGMQFAR